LVVALGTPTAAGAATPAVRARSAATVTADALPTVQINGVVWTQVMIGNVVYAGGEFTSARPAGAAAGQQQIARTNLLAYDITTGKLITTFAPKAFNGSVLALAASPDKKTVYVGGAFTKIGTSTRTFFAALDAKTGGLRSAAPRFNSRVNALAVTSKTVYAGGWFTAVNGTARGRLAAVNASDGKLTKWAPKADGAVNALVLTAAQKRVIAGGSFTKLNKTTASGSGALDPTSGATKSWKVNSVVKNGGKKSAILSLVADSTTVYGTGYTFGTGNFEGVYAASATDGTIKWLQDCHGDVYGAAPIGDLVYSVGHAHYCSNIGGFADTNPRNAWYRALAVSKTAAGTVARNGQTSASSYTNFQGKPAPALYNWFPDLTAGSYTGMTQAAWTVVGNGTYVALAGEFTKVNGKAQQGLVRMAIPAKAPRTMGPQDKTAAITPKAQLQADGTVALSWLGNWDRDDLRLTYRLSRNGVVINSQTVSAPFWKRPTIKFVDTGASATGAASASYAVTVTDPDGNAVTSASTTISLPVLAVAAKAASESTSSHSLTEQALPAEPAEPAEPATTPETQAGADQQSQQSQQTQQSSDIAEKATTTGDDPAPTG
jgi:hypothetical protein